MKKILILITCLLLGQGLYAQSHNAIKEAEKIEAAAEKRKADEAEAERIRNEEIERQRIIDEENRAAAERIRNEEIERQRIIAAENKAAAEKKRNEAIERQSKIDADNKIAAAKKQKDDEAAAEKTRNEAIERQRKIDEQSKAAEKRKAEERLKKAQAWVYSPGIYANGAFGGLIINDNSINNPNKEEGGPALGAIEFGYRSHIQSEASRFTFINDIGYYNLHNNYFRLVALSSSVGVYFEPEESLLIGLKYGIKKPINAYFDNVNTVKPITDVKIFSPFIHSVQFELGFDLSDDGLVNSYATLFFNYGLGNLMNKKYRSPINYTIQYPFAETDTHLFGIGLSLPLNIKTFRK